jgi:hypothetical protein
MLRDSLRYNRPRRDASGCDLPALRRGLLTTSPRTVKWGCLVMALIECPECGHKVSDKAASCPECAYPFQSQGMAPPTMPAAASETCDIDWEVGPWRAWGRREAWFVARAVGSTGPYEAARSSVIDFWMDSRQGPNSADKWLLGQRFLPRDHAKNRKMLDGLLATLSAEGWESFGRAGGNYWEYKLRRTVRP